MPFIATIKFFFFKLFQRQKLEREQLLIELKCKELHEKQLIMDRKQLEDRIRQRLKAKMELQNQLKEIEMRRLQRQQEEDQFRTKQLEMLAEQDRLELLTKERQRVKKQEHYKLVREMLTAREAARNAEIFDFVQQHNELLALEKRRFVPQFFLENKEFSFHKPNSFMFTDKKSSELNGKRYSNSMLMT